MPSYDMWRPSKEVFMLKGSEKILSKEMSFNLDQTDLNIPTFMRKAGFSESGNI